MPDRIGRVRCDSLKDTTSIPHWIDGQPLHDESARAGDVYDPATGDVAGQVGFASAEIVNRAVDSAGRAFAEWRRVSLSHRARVMFEFRSLLVDHREELARLITAEHGKVR